MTKILKIFNQRKKFYIVSYIVTYIISLISTGVPNILYLNPIKLTPLLSSYFIGTTFFLLYSGMKKVDVILHFVKPIIYLLIGAVVVGMFVKPNSIDPEILAIFR